MNLSKKDLDEYARRHKLKLEFLELNKITDQWGYIRQAYMENIASIIEVSKNNTSNWINPYFLDWNMVFSPIETVAWNSIRSIGKIVLYPQVPLFNYFVDFANPYLKIGLELDGKDYHNKHEDKTRDEMLAKFGWKIFRVKGSECQTSFRDFNDIQSDFELTPEEKEEELENWMLNSCDGVINAIKQVYFVEKEYQVKQTIDLSYRTLDRHRLAQFEI